MMTGENQLGIYDQMAARASAAFVAFEQQYRLEVPPPMKPALARDIVSTAIIISLIVVMVAGVIVSSSRTIVEFGGDVVGVAAFIMLEGGLVAYAFFRARRTGADTNRVENARRLATGGLILAFISALAANIHAVLKAQDIITPEIVDTVINLFVAVSAPTLAFISADVLAIELMSGDARKRSSDEQYERMMNEWRDGLREEWQRRQRAMGVSWKVERVENNSIPTLSNGIPLENTTKIIPSASTLGHSKQPQASKIVRDYFQEHPEAVDGNPIEIAALLNVGKSTVYNVIKGMKESQ